MKVLKITILTGKGPDILLLKLDIPNGMWPYDGQSSAKIEVAAQKGEDFVKEHFKDIPYEIIKM